MELNKDIYLYLTNFTDNRTILNMLSVNKKFNDEKFFEVVMRNKYPLLIKFKKPEEGWKQFFIGMVYCISMIEEKHNIPYYQVAGYNPKDYCNSPKQTILDGMMAYAALGGQIDMVKTMIKEGANYFNLGMINAAEGGQLGLVRFFIEKGADDFNWALEEAAGEGHKDIVELMIKEGATDLEWAMAYASHKGHKDIVDLMIKEGANNFNRAMAWAASGGQKDIVKLMIQYGSTNFKNAIKEAEYQGHQDIVDYLKSL